jgi:alpha-L-fucosidase
MELMTNYGDMDILWLDGGWVQKLAPEEIEEAYLRNIKNSETGFLKRGYVSQDIRMDELVASCRKAQPGLIVVDRAVDGKNQNYLTPENRVPDETLPYPWESCIISGGGWSYTPNATYMTGREGIHMLVDVVAKGGNLLLNIAPGPDGKWQQGAYDLLREYADWMTVNHEAIYNTHTFAPYKEDKLCFTQGPDGTIYIIILSDESTAVFPESITTTAIDPTLIRKITMPGTTSDINWKNEDGNLKIMFSDALKNSPPSKYAWVIKVELK